MRADTFAGQVIAVLSRRASAFEVDSAEPLTFPDRLWALLGRRKRTDSASLTSTGVNQVSAGMSEDQIIGFPFARSEQARLSYERAQEEEAALQRFNASLGDNIEEIESTPSTSEQTLGAAPRRPSEPARRPYESQPLSHNDNLAYRLDSNVQSVDTIPVLPEYGLTKQWLDRRDARRDARNGIPSPTQSEPTPTVEKLIAECVVLVGAEKRRLALEVAPLRKQVALLTQRIQETEEDLNRAHELEQETPYHGAATDEMGIWRRQQALAEIRGLLASHRILLAKLNAKIASLYDQHLALLNQIVNYSWHRIGTYRNELIRVHPHGDRLSTVIKWGPNLLANALVISGVIERQFIQLDGSHIAIALPGKN